MLPCVLLACGGEPVRQALRYDRQAVLAGQFWRLLTGNLVHLGAGHLAEDMAGLMLLWLLLEPALAGWRWVATAYGGCLAVGLGLLWFDPGVVWYVGISGALNTLWAAGALILIVRRAPGGLLLGGFLLLKIIWEQTHGPIPFSVATTGGPVIVAAHLYGALAGLCLGAYWLFSERRCAHV
jgi:rhomboid family GlyGly-CTERM serine protease